MTAYLVRLQAVAVLHCLQRLVSHPHMAEQLLSAPTALARVWACLACGSDHVVAEGARLLVRLFAPAPARHGAAPWRLLRSELLPQQHSMLTTAMLTVATVTPLQSVALLYDIVFGLTCAGCVNAIC